MKRRAPKRSPAPPCPHTRYRLIAAHRGPVPVGEEGYPVAVCALCLDCGGVASMLPPVTRAWPGDPLWVSNGSLAKNLEGYEESPPGWRYDLLPLDCGDDPLAVRGPADWARVVAVGKARAELEQATWLQRIDAVFFAKVEALHPDKLPFWRGRICGA